ncbi:hypothetical protein [uncultured Desulfobacter sp.]|uniref:hypothetical protein n=1 Tax=uncultured Desulfobacter sp. TaxID=240139 RepID=UPI0029F51BE4|nr:hypothetical protein [uncultured Desulfobacter sp.]
MTLAKKLGIKFPMTLMDYAQLVTAERKKLLYINSYHKGYQWSDSIEKGLLKAKAVIETWQPDIVVTSDDND